MRRLGVDKPEQQVGGLRLLEVALAAVAGADTPERLAAAWEARRGA